MKARDIRLNRYTARTRVGIRGSIRVRAYARTRVIRAYGLIATRVIVCHRSIYMVYLKLVFI